VLTEVTRDGFERAKENMAKAVHEILDRTRITTII